MITNIRKRDGSLVRFNKEKITNAILKAVRSIDYKDGKLAKSLSDKVNLILNKRFKIPDVEQIQDTVEDILKPYPKILESYSEYRKRRHEVRRIKQKIGVRDELKLSANALKVLQNRYLLRDEKGKVIETPLKLFKRVAKAIAGNKKQEKEFFEVMSRLEFLPNSPTLFNAGTKIGQLSACFTKEQKVLSNQGYKDINQIKIGDKIITHMGSIKKVVRIHKRKYRGKLYTVNVRGLIKPTLKVTSEHPIFAIMEEEIACKRIKNKKCNGFIKEYCLKTPQEYKEDCEFIDRFFKPKWIPIKELEKGDFVVVNTNREVKDVKEIKIEEYIKDSIYLKKGDYLVIKGRPNKGKRIPNKVEIDQDFLRLIGYWLADGSLSKRYIKYGIIRFAFNLKEKEFCKEIKRIMKEKFNLTAKEEFTKKQKTIQLRFNSIIVAELFYKLFGKGFNGKKVPEWVTTLPLEKQFSLVVGLFMGDGCYFKGKKQDMVFISLSNERLAKDVWNILLRLGYNFNINCRKPKKGTKKAYRISAAPSECKELVKAIKKGEYRERKIFPQYVKAGGMILRSVDKIESETFNGDVYNLEVEKDYSYLANGVAVHNCFVLPIEDSLDNIFDAVKSAGKIQQSGGGIGYNFSRIRPRNDIVGSTKGIASGPVSFITIFDKVTDVIKQGSKRRGANMGILNVNHPDILEFINSKTKDSFLSNFNISVAVTDEFMNKVKENKNYNLINPRINKIIGKLNAKKVFDLIVKNAWKTGDPGLIFIDEVNKNNPTPQIGKIESTNPCGEQPLLPYESCNLGSINLSKVVVDGKINWNKLEYLVRIGVDFLDNVIDKNKFPLEEIRKITKANRKIGLGIMGFADFLIKLEIPYDSDKALRIAEKIMKFIEEKAREESNRIAKKKGIFPNIKNSIYKGRRLRNSTLTTIAPTGTISIIADTSSGVEPLFSIAYVREVMEGTRLIEINKLFEETAKKRGFYSKELILKIAKQGSIQNIKEIPKDVKRIFVTAFDIKPEWHVKIQAAFQKYTDNAVSKTINLTNNASINDVEDVYLLAHKLKCKGITIYRYGSKKQQVLYKGKDFIKAKSEYSGGCPVGSCLF